MMKVSLVMFIFILFLYPHKHHKTIYYFYKKTNREREFLLNILPPNIELDHCSITQEKFDELNLKPVYFYEKEDKFIVELNVVKNKKRNVVAILRSVEALSKKGEHEIISQKLIVELPAIEVILPKLY